MAKILVVDDSVTAAKSVEMILSSEGHSLFFAVSGEEALERIKTETFDLIILDVVMPGKNGYQVCREIKSREESRKIPVIMLTTKGLDADRFWGVRQGADEYLTKPCEPEALKSAVHKYIDTKPARQ